MSAPSSKPAYSGWATAPANAIKRNDSRGSRGHSRCLWKLSDHDVVPDPRCTTPLNGARTRARGASSCWVCSAGNSTPKRNRISLNKNVDLAQLMKLLELARHGIEGTDDPQSVKYQQYVAPSCFAKSVARLKRCVLPREEDEAATLQGARDNQLPTYANEGRAANPVLRALLDEARDLIDSPDFDAVLTACLSLCMEQLQAALTPKFHGDQRTSTFIGVPNSVHVTALDGSEEEAPVAHTPSVLLAKTIPLLTSQSQVLTSAFNNPYLAVDQWRDIMKLTWSRAWMR